VAHVVNTTWEREIPKGPFPPDQPGIETFSRLGHDLELDRTSGLLLNYRRPFTHTAVADEVAHAKFDEVTSPQLAVDGNIKEGAVSKASMLIQKESNGPNVSWAKGALRADILPGVPWPSLMDGRI